MTRIKSLALISGSTRAGSTNTSVVLTLPETLREGPAESPAETIHLLPYLDLAKLPHFNPDHDVDPLPAEVVRLRALIAEADAVLFCTPEYAGDLPGSFKNLLDWTVGGMEIVDKPVAWINVSSSPTGAQGAHRALRTVLGYTGAHIIEAACAHIPVPRASVDPATGLITDPLTRKALTEAATTLLAGAGAV